MLKPLEDNVKERQFGNSSKRTQKALANPELLSVKTY